MTKRKKVNIGFSAFLAVIVAMAVTHMFLVRSVDHAMRFKSGILDIIPFLVLAVHVLIIWLIAACIVKPTPFVFFGRRVQRKRVMDIGFVCLSLLKIVEVIDFSWGGDVWSVLLFLGAYAIIISGIWIYRFIAAGVMSRTERGDYPITKRVGIVDRVFCTVFVVLSVATVLYIYSIFMYYCINMMWTSLGPYGAFYNFFIYYIAAVAYGVVWLICDLIVKRLCKSKWCNIIDA